MKFVVRAVDFCRRRALWVVFGFLVLTLVNVWVTATRIDMDTDTDKLISQDLPWKRAEADFDRSFPQQQHLLAAVIDGNTPGAADEAAARLEAALKKRPDLFREVRRGDAPFLRKTALLYEDTADLKELADRLMSAQPLIGALSADPSPRGLLRVLDMTAMGAERGDLDPSRLDPLYDGVARAGADAIKGRAEPVDWSSLFLGHKATTRETRRYVTAQPVPHFDKVAGADSADFLRSLARDAGLTTDKGVRVRVTGTVAMEEEEFKTVADGTGSSALASLALVAVILVLALRSVRIIVPILLTLLAGLAGTFSFAVLVAGTLNPISIAFAVLFIGIGVDFGIQVATRYRDRRHAHPRPIRALIATARGISPPLIIAAVTIAAGFLSFAPTDFVGVSQLGLVASAGMLIAAVLNLTLLPALLTLFHPPAERANVDYPRLAPADRFLKRNARTVVGAFGLLCLASLAAMPSLRFDFNPLNLRDSRTEAVSTAIELMGDPDNGTFSAEILAPSVEAAAQLAAKLKQLPEVGRVLTLNSFVPEDQQAKLAILGDLGLILGPSLAPPEVAPAPRPSEVREAAGALAERLGRMDGRTEAMTRLADALSALSNADDAAVTRFSAATVGGIKAQLDALAGTLAAEPVTLESIPADFARDWRTADGRGRVQVTPKGDGRDPEVLERFERAVLAVAPDASGTAVTIQESARVIVNAFVQAGITALAAIVIVLLVTLRSLRDTALVLAAPVVGILTTGGLLAATGFAFNFANIIALPLMMGVAVAFAIYYVVNHRAGVTEPLRSSTTRAVFFSAATTAVSFGGLGLSAHPGTASMGILLSIGLFMALVATFVALPALLALVPNSRKSPG